MKSVCFTGHRNIKITFSLIRKLYSKIKMLIENGCTDFYAGGALGWDTLCERIVLKLKKRYPFIKLHLVLPCLSEYQTLRWKESDKAVYNIILNSADTVEFTSENYYNGCMKKRNDRLVELSDCCLCYYNEKKFSSGTGQTVRMAEKKEILLFNLYNQNRDG